MKIRLTNIDWDTDGQKIDHLPTKEMIVEIDDENVDINNVDHVLELAIDAASDETGWLINQASWGGFVHGMTCSPVKDNSAYSQTKAE